ncbi:hypothetical protein HMPREF0388_0865 [Mobiluncus curtisii ATCC 51333]|uniref:Uncharacterized protein n=1 Tax=Mobiluncus curtisii ATCC 51333 TaxID=887326 RepID=E6LYC8_9ACTO|nr:hypothetical protein HMPREF0388_0865 [Mobiluncus curtisii ATCC 51333]
MTMTLSPKYNMKKNQTMANRAFIIPTYGLDMGFSTSLHNSLAQSEERLSQSAFPNRRIRNAQLNLVRAILKL